MATLGVALVTFGIVLFIWARRALGTHYSGHLSAKIGQTLVQSGPYRFIRHPAYAGYLLMAMGISLGYSSMAGLIQFLCCCYPA
jgi:protein-S-isoprenylcysteine O-methyltransferase Ste14